MEPRRHMVISGFGRCGTTFLVELLTNLGLDTGYTRDQACPNTSLEPRAGLEFDLRSADCPYIVKSPQLCDHAEEVLQREDLVIEHVFIPLRDIGQAAASRRRVVAGHLARLNVVGRLRHFWRPEEYPAGLWHTHSRRKGVQEVVLLEQLFQLLLALSKQDIPVTLVHFPAFIEDPDYLFRKLQPLLGGISREQFCNVFRECVRPDFVHRF